MALSMRTSSQPLLAVDSSIVVVVLVAIVIAISVLLPACPSLLLKVLLLWVRCGEANPSDI